MAKCFPRCDKYSFSSLADAALGWMHPLAAAVPCLFRNWFFPRPAGKLQWGPR